MGKLKADKRKSVIAALVEGMGVKTPATAAGLTDHRWTLDELCGLAD